MKSNEHLSKSEKILLFLFEFGKGTKTKIRYEDIVAGLFQKHPKDFQLKGYPQYPDSGDLIHKPLYDFKKKGFLTAANKVFLLTDRGVELAQQLSKSRSNSKMEGVDRLSRSTETEVARIKVLEGFLLFAKDKGAELSEGDLYNYLGVTVRTSKSAFAGRLQSVNAMVEELDRHKSDRMYATIISYHRYLLEKYPSIIEFFTQN